LVHVGEARILQRLSGGIEAIDDERIDLPLNLVIDPFAGIEAIFVIGRLHLASDGAFLIAGVELGDRPGAALPGNQIPPTGLDVAAQWRDKAQTGDDDAAHLGYSLTTNGPPTRAGSRFCN